MLDYPAPTKNEDTIHQSLFMPVKSFATPPGPLKLC